MNRHTFLGPPHMIVLCTPMDAITIGICMGTCMDMDIIMCTTATVIVMPALAHPHPRRAYLQQPGMPVHAICVGSLTTAMMPAHPSVEDCGKTMLSWLRVEQRGRCLCKDTGTQFLHNGHNN